MAGASPHRVLLASVLASAVLFSACGDEDEQPATSATEEEAAAGLDPTAVESSVEEFLASDEAATGLSATVDCGEEPGETLDCTITGDKGLSGSVSAARSQGFQYTGEIEGPKGPSSVGGSSPEGSLADPETVDQALDEILADDPGEPRADCADVPDGDELACEVTGNGVTGTLTATPIGGFEWEGQIETPAGTRAISGNALPE